MKPEQSFFYKRNRGRRRWLFLALILMLPLGILSSVSGSTAGKTERSAEKASGDRLLPVKSAASITGTDALGRRLKRVSGYQEEKYVGLFYFLWLGQQNQKAVYDITDILRTSALSQLLDTNSDAYPNDLTYFFNEPLYGYYNSADPFVLRKHIELFIAADIDFLVFDVSNGIYYDEVWMQMLALLEEYRLAGWNAPKIAFFTNTNSGEAVRHLYTALYRKGLYPELWFYGPYDKPLIIAREEEVPAALREFFCIRPPQWPLEEPREMGFPYMDLSKPQKLYTDLINVSVCQFSGPCSDGVSVPRGAQEGYYGRGYSAGTPENGNVRRILEGKNFQEQWEAAIQADPQMIFVTGWNEWIAQKSAEGYGWIDTFNTEWSRDIEMTKARDYASDDPEDYTRQGYGDNYYLQMINAIREYKGEKLTKEQAPLPERKTIDIAGSPAQWTFETGSPNVFYNIAVKNTPRDFAGASPALHYTQKAAENFITELRVTHDDTNLYFYLKTEEAIRPRKNGASNWMNLFFSVYERNRDKTEAPSWEGFQYVLNRTPVSDTLTSLERVRRDGEYVFESVQNVASSVQGNVMQIAVPFEALRISAQDFRLDFKAADSVEREDDIMDYYVSGCAVPLGRLTYSYSAAEVAAPKTRRSLAERILLAITGLLLIGAAAASLLYQYGTEKRMR